MVRKTISRAVLQKFNDYLGYTPHPPTPSLNFEGGEDLDDERDNMNNEKHDRSSHPDFSDNTPHPPTPSPKRRGGDEPNDEQGTQINHKLNRRDLPISKMERGPGGEDIFSKTVRTDLSAYLLNFARDLLKKNPFIEILQEIGKLLGFLYLISDQYFAL